MDVHTETEPVCVHFLIVNKVPYNGTTLTKTIQKINPNPRMPR